MTFAVLVFIVACIFHDLLCVRELDIIHVDPPLFVLHCK